MLNPHFPDFITFCKHYPVLPACREGKDGTHHIFTPTLIVWKVSESPILKKEKS